MIFTQQNGSPYSRISNLEKIAEGGFSIIYKATMCTNKTVAVKRILNSRDISKCFLNEVIIIFFKSVVYLIIIKLNFNVKFLVKVTLSML